MPKIITDKKEIIDINYYEIENFCKNEILKNKEDIENFNIFKEEYKTFNAYFDYIFHKKKYTLLNPLLIPDTILYNENMDYYIIDLKREQNNLSDFSLSNDTCIPILKSIYNLKAGFFILVDGTIITTDFVERHLSVAKNILNAELIESISVYNKYLKYIEQNKNSIKYNIIDFLTEELGIVYGKKQGIFVKLILNNELITKEQNATINKLKKVFNVIDEYCDRYKTEQKMFYK